MSTEGLMGVLQELKLFNQRLMTDLVRMTAERDEYKRLAESWMADYDKLKTKYEPTFGVMPE